MSLRYHGRLPVRDAKMSVGGSNAFYSHSVLKSHAFAYRRVCVGDSALPVLQQHSAS